MHGSWLWYDKSARERRTRPLIWIGVVLSSLPAAAGVQQHRLIDGGSSASDAWEVQQHRHLHDGSNASGAREAIPAAEQTVHLVTFRSCSQNESASCNHDFHRQVASIHRQAKAFPMISHHHLFKRLPSAVAKDVRWSTHLGKSTGRGFWFWKPVIINHLLSEGKIKDGEIVLWADADSGDLLGDKGHPELWQYGLDAMNKDGLELIIKPSAYCEHEWTKGDLFVKFGTSWNSTYGLTKQVHANFFVAKINPHTRQFFRHWEALAQDYHLLSNEESVWKEADSPKFYQNRNDQSVFSLLVKANAPQWPDKLGFSECYKPGLTTVRSYKEIMATWPPRNPVYGIDGLRIKIIDFQDLAMQLVKERIANPSNYTDYTQLMERSDTKAKAADPVVCIDEACANLSATFSYDI